MALHCIGYAWQFLIVQETALFSLLWGEPDVGGLGWSEAHALGVQSLCGWCLSIAAVCTLVRPCGWVLMPVGLLQVVMAIAETRRLDGIPLDAVWLPMTAIHLLTVATQAARIGAPWCLWLLDPWRPKQSVSPARDHLAIEIARWCVAITFCAHGLEALAVAPVFVDLIILSARQHLAWEISESAAAQLLWAIGMIDLLLATAIVTTRWKSVAWYMAFWGLVTAGSRVTAWGTDHWYECSMRASHFGLPLILALYWTADWQRKSIGQAGDEAQHASLES